MTVAISTISDERQFVQYMAMRNAPRDTLVYGVHPNSHKALAEYAVLLEALQGGHEATDEEPWTTVDLSGMATYHANAIASVTPFVAAMQVSMATINSTMHIVNLLAVATGQDAPFAIEAEEITVQDYLTTLATAITTLQAAQTAMQQAAQALGGGE